MWRRKLPRQEVGKPIAAATINRTAEAAEWASRIQANAPLKIIATAMGPLLTYAAQVFGAYVCVSSSSITARSGGTPGKGTATIQTISFSSGDPALAASSIPDIHVYNISAAAGGIATGKYMIVMKIGPFYWVVTAEC